MTRKNNLTGNIDLQSSFLQTFEREYRPWGSYLILCKETGYQVKHIVVDPEQRLSLQLHHHRDEHWVIVKGVGVVTLEEEVFTLSRNERIYIPKMARHRIQNRESTSLEFIEVQTGDYLEEDDIDRFDDDYGRV